MLLFENKKDICGHQFARLLVIKDVEAEVGAGGIRPRSHLRKVYSKGFRLRGFIPATHGALPGRFVSTSTCSVTDQML